MSSDSWFVASLVLAVLNERVGLWRRVTSVVLVRAAGFEEAFDKACRRGFEQETRYVNVDDEGVRWAFEQVATLDILPEALVDGVEIYSEPGPLINDRSVPFDQEFDPREIPPGQSGVG